MARKGATVRFPFTNELGAVERFERFYTSTFKFTPTEFRKLRGAKVHFEKSITLIDIAKKLVPNLDIDERQAEENGFSPTHNAHELCTVVESAILELYSTIDCARSVFVAVFKGSRGMPNESTRKFFGRLQAGNQFGQPFPERLAEVVRHAVWFPELMALRDTLTHFDTGFIIRDRETSNISYFHPTHGKRDNAMLFDDVFMWLAEAVEKINQFLGETFSILLSILSHERVEVFCGFVDGRILQRSVSYIEDVSGSGGDCLSAEWFDQPGNPRCPLVEICPIYLKL